MKRKIIKILTILFTILLIVVMMQNISMAAVGSTDITSNWKGKDIAIDNGGGKAITNILGMVLTVVRTVAIGISIIMITYLGIKYMSAAPSEKAGIKNQLITFVIGVTLVVGAVSILDIIKNFATT